MIFAKLIMLVAVCSVVHKVSSATVLEKNLKSCSSLSNGCSNYGLLREYESYFTTACNIHDVCYNCGKKFLISRARCDSAFLTNMLKGCLRILDEWEECFRDAMTYYAAVRFLGSAFFRKKAHSGCKMPCASRVLRG